MKHVLIRLTAALTIVLLLTSCASLPRGRGDGHLSVGIEKRSTVERADIFLDGEMLCTVYRGEAHRTFQMPAGYYRMRIVTDSHEPWERVIEVVDGDNYQEIHVRLEGALSTLLHAFERISA